MRKVPKENEGPIDNILLDGCEIVAPYVHGLGLVPNDITSLSLLFGFAASIALKNRNVTLFGCLYMISYAADVLDGFVARSYDQCTALGDMYDHITDIVLNLYILVLIFVIYQPRPVIFFAIVGVVFTLMYSTLGCSQKLLPRTGEFLDVTRGFCPNGFEGALRLFSPATFHLVIIALTWYLDSQTSR